MRIQELKDEGSELCAYLYPISLIEYIIENTMNTNLLRHLEGWLFNHFLHLGVGFQESTSVNGTSENRHFPVSWKWSLPHEQLYI